MSCAVSAVPLLCRRSSREELQYRALPLKSARKDIQPRLAKGAQPHQEKIDNTTNDKSQLIFIYCCLCGEISSSKFVIASSSLHSLLFEVHFSDLYLALPIECTFCHASTPQPPGLTSMKMISPRLLLGTGLLIAATSVSAQLTHDLMTFSCSELIVSVQNQTEADFFSQCPSLPFRVGFTHTYNGSFSMPGVKSIGQFSSGYLGPKLKGSTWIDDGVTSISMPDLLNATDGGLLFGYLPNLTSVDFP